ncbi:MAG: HAMP domain-containing protein [Deltaproteobacteria bacterium]|nr:HAMP domain-containing protein [Deltaproteobacteria bacterium]
MKKKIVIGLAVYSILFFFMGLYIVYKIQIDTAKLNDLIQLHQVEILRENFLIQIKRVQADLALKNSRFSRSVDTMVLDIQYMQNVVDVCFGCHHAPAVQAGIDDIRGSIQRYRDSLDRVLDTRSDASRLAEEESGALRDGEVLIEKVSDMVALTNDKLKAKTKQTLYDIGESRNVLYLLLAMGPMLSLGLAATFIGGFSKSVNRLLEATRILKAGNLDHRVEGLKDEFGELASSFNIMAGSIKEQMRRMREAEQTLENSNRELKQTQEQMVRAETMAALGTLSSGISHELNTPLSVILNLTQLIKADAKDNPSLLKDLNVLEREANQASKVTRSLLGFARSAKSVKERVNVNQVLEELFKIIEFQPSARMVRLRKNLARDLRLIHVNSGQVRQVLLNVILNAIQAMPEGGDLEVSSANRSSDVQEGVEIVFSDTGSGIPKEHIDKVFQPFFTTKQDGTGLGLAISYGIVQEHQGRIAVESEVGRGTTVRIFLPEGTPSETRQ